MGLFDGMKLVPFCQRLKAARVRKGYTDMYMASKLGIDIDTYRLYESGDELMPNFTIIRVAKLLDCPTLAANVHGTGGRGKRGQR